MARKIDAPLCITTSFARNVAGSDERIAARASAVVALGMLLVSLNVAGNEAFFFRGVATTSGFLSLVPLGPPGPIFYKKISSSLPK